MALKMAVKAGKIGNLSDARYCAGMGVDFLGFAMDGANRLTFEKFKEINQWVSGPEIVLEVSEPGTLPDVLNEFYGQHLEIPASWLGDGALPPDYSLLVRTSINEWPMVNPLVAKHKARIKAIILEHVDGKAIESINTLAAEYSVMIDFTSSTLGVEEILTLPVYGLAVEGSDEMKPGLKDFDNLAEVLEQLETD